MPRLPIDIRVDFPALMERMRRIRTRISRVDLVQRLIGAGVDVFFGEARFAGSDVVTVANVNLRFQEGIDRSWRSGGHTADSGPRGNRLSDQRERLRF